MKACGSPPRPRPRRRARALGAAAAAAAVAAVVAVVAAAAAIPGAAAQRTAAVKGLSRGRGVLLGAAGSGLGRIVGGRNVTLNDAVYGGGFFTKLLFQTPQGPVFYCAGALVKSNKILTAAHCYDGGDPATAVGDTIRIGGLDLSSGLEATISSVAIHPSYSSTVLGNFDIAIVTIANPPTPAAYRAAGVAPAFVNAFSRFPRAGSTLFVAGHGLTTGVLDPAAPPALSEALRLTPVRVNAWSQCNGFWAKLLPPALAAVHIVPAASQPLQVCGGLGTADSTCLGDSGGALFERQSLGGRDFFRIFGVVSYGVSLEEDLCPVIHPAYFAATSAASAFISANM